jgi:hypothetical protein
MIDDPIKRHHCFYFVELHPLLYTSYKHHTEEIGIIQYEDISSKFILLNKTEQVKKKNFNFQFFIKM